MRFGKYDQKIQFISFGSTPDGLGGYIPNEEVLLTTLARINQLKHSSDLEQLQMGLPTAFRVRVIVRGGFNPKVGMSVKWKGVVYHIITSPQVESVRYMNEWIFDITEKGNG